MAPAAATTSASPLPSPSAVPADWTDFVNTIGTAIGPILTLFGELATKQFLSTSMGWQDDIILAVGPIGIIAVVISAIRIAGYRWLKAIVGRAMQSLGTPTPSTNSANVAIPGNIEANTQSAQMRTSEVQQKGVANDELLVGFFYRELYKQDPQAKAVINVLTEVPNIPQGKCAHVASKLATALLGIMKVLGPSGELRHVVHWDDSDRFHGAHPWFLCDWRIATQRGSELETSLIVRTGERSVDGFGKDHHDMLSHDLNAGLVLWMYSLTSKNNKSFASIAPEENREGRAINHTSGVGSTSGPHVSKSRIVGNRQAPRTEDEIQDWIWMEEDPYTNPSRPYQISSHNNHYNNNTYGLFPGRIKNWPIFGLHYSSCMKIQSKDRTPDYFFSIQVDDNAEDRADDIYLWLPKSLPLEEMLALEILSLFMLSICRSIRRIGGKAKRGHRRLEHPLITAIAQKIVHSGLVEDIPSALCVIVPAFARCNLLPEEGRDA